MMQCVIKHWRNERGLTQETLAERVGISQETLSRYEAGVIQGIPSARLWQLARALGITVNELFEEDDASHVATRAR